MGLDLRRGNVNGNACSTNAEARAPASISARSWGGDVRIHKAYIMRVSITTVLARACFFLFGHPKMGRAASSVICILTQRCDLEACAQGPALASSKQKASASASERLHRRLEGLRCLSGRAGTWGLRAFRRSGFDTS